MALVKLAFVDVSSSTIIIGIRHNLDSSCIALVQSTNSTVKLAFTVGKPPRDYYIGFGIIWIQIVSLWYSL